jgi:hypothetical protein
MVSIGSAGSFVKTIKQRKTPDTISAGGFEKIWRMNSPEKSDFCVLRVVSNAAANEIKNAGTWLTKPSPMVSLE